MVQLIFPFENEFDKTNYNGIETIEKYCSKKPELAFLDLAMPKFDGLNVLKKFDSKIPLLKL